MVVLSVTEGDDKPLKYPAIFTRAEVVLITKIDLAPHVDFDPTRAIDNVLRLNPAARILPTAAATGEGMDAWCRLLEERMEAKASPPASNPAWANAPLAT